ncbi:reverse transcriptase domain-containing protein [Tanacetum coccineum]
MMASSPICLLSKASKTKSWLWHQRLSHLNFGAINHLARHGLVRGLPKLKFEKYHMCSACAMGKSKKKPYKPKSEDTNQEKLYLLHMDLCGPMRIASVNGKKYILVIVGDYSRFIWVKWLRSKDEAPDFIIKFLKMIQKVGISHETSVARSPQQMKITILKTNTPYPSRKIRQDIKRDPYSKKSPICRIQPIGYAIMAPKKRTIKASPATTTTTTTPVINAQLKALINQGVADALAAHDAERSQNNDDSYNLGTGSRRTERTVRECNYTDFLKCQPLNFKGTEGVAGLSQWLERMESVFHISNCVVENQVKFATCTLYSVVLTWWNTHVKTVGHDAAYEIKKLEIEIWDLKVKGIDLMSYTQLFKELALLCGRMFPEESDKIDKYVGGLPDMIHESVMTSKPKIMQDAIEIATELMEKKINSC